MRSWLGQDIEVGTIVGRGARNGNSSEFKVGRVIAIKNDKPRVQWLWGPAFLRDSIDTGKKWANGYPIYQYDDWGWYPSKRDSAGTPSVESLFVLDPSVLDNCERHYDLVQEKNERKETMPMTKAEYLSRVEAIYG